MTTAPHAAPPLRAVILDDEPVARRGVRLLLERDPEIAVAGEAGTGAESVALIRREKPDIALVDVQMPEGDGFQVLSQVGAALAPAVIFVTAYDEHALRAFDVNAVDYLLKPYEDARFFTALDRAKAEVRARSAGALNAKITRLLEYLERGAGANPQAAPETGRIVIRSSGEITFLRHEDIDWIEADGDYAKFHAGGRTHLLRETMARLEARLDPRRFVRIHRSTIVALDRVVKLSPLFGSEYAVILRDGTRLRLSRGYHGRLGALGHGRP